ncbi:putative anti-sigma regulatory factor, serine/threonine protein kinase [Candidatus Koribacter versatilis Ellin345]|uniref:Anti-sigma regulatory factor, serine/threonine protein kinase n=1 Tax=Koribacter versatilis (strain Ellin345) TaxID=204669 RepID=Q1INN4_KORVE|nr:ATP-binding protein [Candidatus Koribacter versatilis]ABF41516.1 putative anti-sigma regulatory factor, serine/threonine protein kinase [Candidatus Koribacter versatilis Ellin345]
MTVQRVSYTLESSLDSVNKAEEEATKIATRSGFDEDEAGRISMAVREATVNAVLHGNHYDTSKRVTLSFETTGDELIITVQDQGPGLDPTGVADPLAPENLLKQSGRGIFLIRAFMDDVQFRNLEPGTEIKLIKRVHATTSDHKEASQ